LSTCFLPLHYLTITRVMDHAESHVTVLSWLAWNGKELYPNLSGMSDYGLFYGPYCYFFFGLIPLFFGSSFFASKLGGIGCYFLLAGLSFYSISKVPHVSKKGALGIASVFWMAVLSFGQYAYWVRPDSVILAGTFLAYTLGYFYGGIGAAIGVGVAAGVVANCKVQAFFYVLPLLVVLVYRLGFILMLLSLVVAVITGFAPFLLPWVSLPNFLEILQTAVDQGRAWRDVFVSYVPFAILMTLPAFTVLFFDKTTAMRKRNLFEAGILVVSIAALVLVAAKPGAGYYQLLPLFVPVFFIVLTRSKLFTDLFKSNYHLFFKAIFGGAVLLLFTLFVSNSFFSIKQMRGMAKIPVLKEFKEIELQFPDLKIAQGWGDWESNGDTYNLSFYRAYFVWKGHPYFFDLGIQMDMNLVGRGQSKEALRVFRECLVDIWVIQKGERPFAMKGWIGGGQLYSQSFTDEFQNKHKKVGSTDHFDIWKCI
jgi:hypothetical protein